MLNGLAALCSGGNNPMVVGGDLNFGILGLQQGLKESFGTAAELGQKTYIPKSHEDNFLHGDLAVVVGGLVAMQENSGMGGILRGRQRRPRRGSCPPGASG